MQTAEIPAPRLMWHDGTGDKNRAADAVAARTLVCSLEVTGRFVSDENYLAALKARDPEAEARLITRFAAPVRAKLRARLRSPELIEDASQETFLRVLTYFRSGKTLNNPASLPSFVHGICHNVALELLRGHTRQDQIPEHHEGPLDAGISQPDRLVSEERVNMVRRLLSELSEKDGRLLKRIFLDEGDRDAVCREFHVNRNYLRTVVFRARQRLRNLIEREGYQSAAASR